MGLDNKYFSYCKEIGIMKENYTQQQALDTLKNELKKTYEADPAFVEKVSNLTLQSYEVSVRSCILYHYNINVDYVVGGGIQHKVISDFGHSGVHDSLHITEWKGEGTYTILKDASQVPYQIYNDKNLFTYEAMKNALSNAVKDRLPNNCTYYESKSWDVSAYIVPVLVVIVQHNGKEYQLYYNLQNGHYRWAWPIDPVMLKNGKKAHNLAKMIRFFSIALAIASVIICFASEKFENSLFGIAVSAFNIWFVKKKAKGLTHYQDIFRKNRDKNVYSLLITEYVLAGLALIALIVALA